MDTAGESPVEGETVCEALARCEATLHAAVHELHADVGAFKLGIERRLEEADRLTGPLGRAVAQLQMENRQLRSQLEALTRRVEALTGATYNRNTNLDSISNPEQPEYLTRPNSIQQTPQPTIHQSAISPNAEESSAGAGPAQGPMEARFSSRATIAVFGKSSSIEKEELIEVDPTSASTVLENGQQTNSEKAVVSQEPKASPGDTPQEHLGSMARSHIHLPITATTKTSEPTVVPVIKAPEPLVSPARAQPTFPVESQLSSQPASSNALHHAVSEPLSQPAPAVKTWVPGPVKMMGSAVAADRTSSTTSKSATYSSVTPPRTDRGVDTGRGVEKRRELVRSQTLPRSIGVQPRHPEFERLDSYPSRPKAPDSKPKLKRSQSFGVSSASSIKQILLEWCRSKTIGYQNVDIQNFSSSWSDGMAFCALVHSFFPNEFDYNVLTPANRKHNFEVAFSTAEEKASCDRLIEVEDMMVMGHKPDPMCVFTYVQSLYNHLRRFE